jgi:drug/metabolite transporter (DMT)-like permease
MNRNKVSVFLGIVTIVCWGSLAILGNLLIHLPPFYVLGVTFLVGSLPAWLRPKEMFPRPGTLFLGVSGFFGYHFFLFYSFRFAPALEANLINYLWPVFLVLFTPLFFPEAKLKTYHILGGVLAVIGSVVLVLGKGGELRSEYLLGYLLALGAALSWPLYSLGKKKLPPTSVWSIGGFCFVSGLLSFVTHFLLEPRVVLQFHDAWKLFLLGAGPFGLAFYLWDLSLRWGDARVIGALSYLTPVLSTLGLVLFAGQELTGTTLWAMALIFGGASFGLLDFFPRKR